MSVCQKGSASNAKVKEHLCTSEDSALGTKRQIFRRRRQSSDCRQIHAEACDGIFGSKSFMPKLDRFLNNRALFLLSGLICKSGPFLFYPSRS